jgi:hypothetical protein
MPHDLPSFMAHNGKVQQHLPQCWRNVTNSMGPVYVDACPACRRVIELVFYALITSTLWFAISYTSPCDPIPAPSSQAAPTSSAYDYVSDLGATATSPTSLYPQVVRGSEPSDHWCVLYLLGVILACQLDSHLDFAHPCMLWTLAQPSSHPAQLVPAAVVPGGHILGIWSPVLHAPLWVSGQAVPL